MLSWPSRPSAPSTACPWGSEISGFRTTSTTTRDTPTRVPAPRRRPSPLPVTLVSHRPRDPCGPNATKWWRSAPDGHHYVASGTSAGRESVGHGPQDGAGPTEHIRGREPQHLPAGQDDAVLAAQIPHEHVAFAVHVAVELDHDT